MRNTERPVPHPILAAAKGDATNAERRRTLLVDAPEFWKKGALAAAVFLDALRAEPALNGTFLSPPAHVKAGERTGCYLSEGNNCSPMAAATAGFARRLCCRNDR